MNNQYNIMWALVYRDIWYERFICEHDSSMVNLCINLKNNGRVDLHKWKTFMLSDHEEAISSLVKNIYL